MLESWGRPSRLMVARMPSCRTLRKWRARSRSIIAHKCYSRRPKAPAASKSAVKANLLLLRRLLRGFLLSACFLLCGDPGSPPSEQDSPGRPLGRRRQTRVSATGTVDARAPARPGTGSKVERVKRGERQRVAIDPRDPRSHASMFIDVVRGVL